MIIRGGENISPAEIEAGAPVASGGREAVCFGVADAKYGELVGGRRDARGRRRARGPASRTAAGSSRRSRCPSGSTSLDEIPRTPTGKVQRRRVAEFVAQRRAGA